MIKVYAYSGCDGCKKALKWLKSKEIEHTVIPIRDTPPTESELFTMLEHQNGQLKKLFNVSGQDYRKLGLKDTLPSMSQEDAINMLSANGNLVKRPFVIGEGLGLVGFKEEVWRSTLL